MVTVIHKIHKYVLLLLFRSFTFDDFIAKFYPDLKFGLSDFDYHSGISFEILFFTCSRKAVDSFQL